MQIVKTKAFQRWAKEVGLDDQSLLVAVEEMGGGLLMLVWAVVFTKRG